MKWLIVVLSVIVLVFAAVYVLLFTPFGNGIVAPVVEAKINESLPLKATLEQFELKTSRFSIALQLSENNRIEAAGDYSLFAQSANVAYRVRLDDFAELGALTQKPLYGRLHIDGKITGTLDKLQITGNGDLAEGDTQYTVILAEFSPSAIHARVVDAKLVKLLYMAGEPAYADGDLNIDLTLTDLDPENLKGHANVKLSNGEFKSQVFKKAFDIILPETSFTYDLDAQLNGEQITYRTVFASNLAEIDSKGTIVPKTAGLDLDYRLAVKKLELLKPMTHAPLQGPLNLDGTAKGDKTALTIKGKSDLAKSKTTFEAELTEFTPKSIRAKVKGLDLAAALHMASQPHYADGVLDVDADIRDAGAGKLKGSINSVLRKGVVDGKVVSKAFAFKPMPQTTFSAMTTTQLNEDRIDTKADITSSLANVTIKQARIDLGKELFTSDYKAIVPDLDKLYFVTERHLKGGITVTGDVKQGTLLDLNAHADTLGGTLDAHLHNDDLHADFEEIQTLDALEMLLYPQVFNASLEGALDYNLKSRKGDLNAKLSDGEFAQNIMIDLIKQFGRINLYEERFKGTLKSKINKELIYSDLDLKSNKSAITGENIKFNSETQQIKANLDVTANNNPIGVKIKGNVNKPDVKVDVSKLIKKEAEKAIEKGLMKQLEKLF